MLPLPQPQNVVIPFLSFYMTANDRAEYWLLS